ncbi:hypothetical protein EI427_12950 [Flammeovirga pectinis]|uniref:Uncharacterized protein n=1 Tax=Flammeovirga pectinis TaxID=2494373 RepID=A0A3Q9FPN8_9BACT|nr:hypothetical protein [Flammeovirga pectinis]AZQ63113.1 hypothetical protein EI427_12950 [Flammeovirga pectinis]
MSTLNLKEVVNTSTLGKFVSSATELQFVIDELRETFRTFEYKSVRDEIQTSNQIERRTELETKPLCTESAEVWG